MKFALFIVGCMAAAALSLDADAGYFVPKAFYSIDANGHQSDVHQVSPHIAHYLRRLRRESVSASSSSSSATAGNGQTVFSTQQLVQHTPDFGLASRFGGAPESTGHYVQTTGVVDNNGQVYYKTNQGHLPGQYNSNVRYPTV